MFYNCNLSTARAALGALLLTFIAACSDVPSGLRQPVPPAQNNRVADDAGPTESIRVRATRAVLHGDRLEAVEGPDQLLQVRQGVALVELAGIVPGAESASDVTNHATMALRVTDRGVAAPAFLRKSRFEVRLADGRTAVVTRDMPADGPSSLMTVQVGADEWQWQRTWEKKNGRFELLNSAVETRRQGRVVSRSVLSVAARRLAEASVRRPSGPSRQLMLAAARFGSLAGTVLLPKALGAQSQAGKACNGAATSLANAWVTWRAATVSWAIVLATGTLAAIGTATVALLAASGSVDNAEANYIDCYVAAAYAGVPDGNVARPPVADEL